MIKNIFLVGAPKCGTTKLADYFKYHPSINITNPKEVNYFSYNDLISRDIYYDEWLCSNFDDYKKSFQQKDTAIYACDSSVSYFDSQNAPHKIYEYDKNSKIIIILRDPIERAKSHFKMDSRLGYIYKTLDEILDDEASEEYNQTIGISLYYNKVKKYIDLFGTSNVYIISFEEFKKDNKKVIKDICNFLDIPLSDHHSDNSLVNNAITPNNSFIKYFYKFGSLRRAFRKIFPKNFHNFLRSKLFSKQKEVIFSKETDSKLYQTLFNDFNRTRNLLLKLGYTGLNDLKNNYD